MHPPDDYHVLGRDIKTSQHSSTRSGFINLSTTRRSKSKSQRSPVGRAVATGNGFLPTPPREIRIIKEQLATLMSVIKIQMLDSPIAVLLNTKSRDHE